MPLYKFSTNDVFRNRIITHPRTNFLINNGTIVYNGEIPATGKQDATPRKLTHSPSGYLSLYEINVDKNESAHTFDAATGNGETAMAYPFITKAGSLTAFKTVSVSSFQNFAYGDIMSSSYPLTSSVAVEHHRADGYVPTGCTQLRRHISSLRNTFEHYAYMSPHYAWDAASAAYGTWAKSTQEMALVSLPSIFYGSSIKKGTVKLKFYITGSLIGQLEDFNRNGELIQVLPADSNKGKVAGVVLYNEGIMALTGSWDLDTSYKDYFLSCPDCLVAHPDGSDVGSDPDPIAPTWTLWGTQGNPDDDSCNEVLDSGGSHYPINKVSGPYSVTLCPSASWGVEFQGTTYVSVLTMMAHAPMGQLNHSNNPTYVKRGQAEQPLLDGTQFIEKDEKALTNIAKSVYTNYSESFEKTTYISKVGIYDEDKNLIAIAKVATPVKKTEDREYTFKIKLDF
jgi:hypothetical protein